MIKLHRKAEDIISLIFYSPVHHTNSHFMLLEIDNGEKVICYYDSLAELTTINGMKETRIATLVEASSALKTVDAFSNNLVG